MGRTRSWLLGGLLYGSFCWRAIAQPGPLVSCVATASAAPVYATGIAEPLSDILLRCASAAPSLPAVRSDLRLAISVSLNTSVTNSIREIAGSQIADAVLVVNGNDCARPSASGSTFGLCGASVATVQDPQYGLFSGGGTLEWSNVSVPFPGGLRADGSGQANPDISTLRIRGIRGNASQLNLASGAGPAGPPLAASLIVRSDSAVALRNGTLSLAYPISGLGLRVSSEETVSACQGDERGRAIVQLREGFPNAFSTGTASPPRPTATRILLEFEEVPEGVSIRLPAAIECSQPGFDGSDTGIAEALALGLVSGHGSDGAGGGVVSPSGGGSSGVPVDLSNGLGQAVYEVISHDPAQVEDCHLPVRFEADSGRTASARATFRAGLAPRSSVFVASGDAPQPRFTAPSSGQETVVGFASCGTTLMFPFVTNQAGFTTGIVITPGSRQALTGISHEQAGSCDLHYYGATAEGEEVLLIQHSTMIDPGDQLVFTLSGGNPDRNILGTNQFQGYMMAICGNPDARGYVFISDGFGGIADLAMGYLAPVVPVGSDGKRLVPSEDTR